MSLFLGNLSPRIRRDELERVFRRFGRSNVQLKDGFGFVIYDVPINAERALRALRGKVICGEHISLTWANKQPRPFQRSTRSARFLEPQHGRNFTREEDNGVRNKHSLDRKDFTTNNSKYLKRNPGEKDYGGEDTEEQAGEKGQNLKERVLNEGGASESNPMEHDRWGEPVGDSLNDHVVENETEFDRYEPYHGFDSRDETEKQHMTSSYDSARGSSPGKARREKPGFDNPKQICYICGLRGHKMRNCPRADAPRRGFGRRRDGGIEFRNRSEGGLKKLRNTSRGRSNARDIMLSVRHVNHRKESGSWKPRRLVKRAENFPENRESRRSRLRRDSQGKKRRRREHGSPNKHSGKKARTSNSSLVHSDSTASLHSSSSKSVSGISSRSHSRSVSSGSRSVSSSSRSASASSYSQSRSSKSRLRVSSSRSLSLSISLGRQSPSSLKKLQDVTSTFPVDDLGHATAPKSEQLSLKQRSPVGDVGLECLEQKNMSTIRKREMNEMQPSEEGAFAADNSSLQNFRELGGLQKSESVQMDLAVSPSRTLKPQLPVNFEPSSSTRIPSQEMCRVLKHYGLKVPQENDHLSVDAFFGAARLWPWEMIYYRRLKKGPISTENYARRIAQNKEFGIVDKYIRSSSGWGECDGSNS